MSSVSIAGDTSGSILLAAPAVAGSSTLTLPTTGGTVLSNKTSGAVIQTVYSNPSTQYSTSSSSLTGTVSLAITPQFSTSKILVNWMIAGGCNGGNNVGAHWALYRNGSSIADYPYVLYNSQSSAGQLLNPVPIVYVGSPASTSAVTYQLYIGTSGTTTVTVNNYYSSFLVLQEIAG